MSLTVNPDPQAGAPIPVVYVRLHPLPRIEVWPVTLGLIPALHPDHPLGVAVVQPGVGRRGIAEPSATRLEWCGRRVSHHRPRADESYGAWQQEKSNHPSGPYGMCASHAPIFPTTLAVLWYLLHGPERIDGGATANSQPLRSHSQAAAPTSRPPAARPGTGSPHPRSCRPCRCR